MNTPLARVFRYNKWANERIIDACSPLSDDQLDTKPGGGTYGTIRATLLHLIDAQRSFLARLDGRAQANGGPAQWAGFDALAALSVETSDGLITAAEALVEDADVVLSFMGKRPVFPKSFFLTHAIAHGVEHRTQIGVIFARLGLIAPDLDGWQYAEAVGYGEES